MNAHRLLIPGIAGAALAVWLSAEAEGGKGRIEVCRHHQADGRGAVRVDLAGVEKLHHGTAADIGKAVRSGLSRVAQARLEGHRSGLRACNARRDRTVGLKEPVPPQLGKSTLYLVAATRGGRRPSILPASLPPNAEIFVTEADSSKDVLDLSKKVGRRVTLATRDFAAALGVECAPSRVTFEEDGRRSVIQEEVP